MAFCNSFVTVVNNLWQNYLRLLRAVIGRFQNTANIWLKFKAIFLTSFFLSEKRNLISADVIIVVIAFICIFSTCVLREWHWGIEEFFLLINLWCIFLSSKHVLLFSIAVAPLLPALSFALKCVLRWCPLVRQNKQTHPTLLNLGKQSMRALR